MWRERQDTTTVYGSSEARENTSPSPDAASGHVLALGGGPGMQAGYLMPALNPFVSKGYTLHLMTWLHTPVPAGGEPQHRRPAPHELGLWAQVEAVERFRRTVGAECPWFVAHSAGVAVVVGYALRYPERVGGLVLFDGAARALRPPSGVLPILMRVQWARLTRRISPEEAFLRIFPQASLPLYFSAAWLHQAPDHAATAIATVRRSFAPPFWDVLTAPVMNHDLRAHLGQLAPGRERQKQPTSQPTNLLARVPALVVRGDQDDIISEAVTKELFAALTRAQLVAQWASIPGAGHYPMIERPETCAQVVSAFLDAAQRWRTNV